jgi:acetylornithine deacetylase
VLYLLLRALANCQIVPIPTLVIHLVAEEENGGNGTLAVLRNGESADAAIVLEPTDRTVVVAARGAIWFRIITTGKSAHSGQSTTGCSALNIARKAMAAFEQYHDELLLESRSVPYFDQFENPMPLTFGILQSGDWPASTPSRACLEGVFGFLPNKSRDSVCAELRKRLQEALPDPGSYELKFTFRHDGFSVDAESWLPKAVLQAASAAEYPSRAGPMLASSDAWLYKKFLDIPTVLFGAGSLTSAHSDDEHVLVSDVRGVCLTLLNLVTSNSSQEWHTQ